MFKLPVYLLIITIILTLWINMPFGLSYETRAFEPTGCTSADAIWYIKPSQIRKCLESCARQTACLAINYNRLTSLCVLRDSDLAPIRNGNCYHITLKDNITILADTDPCRLRPCDNRSICESDGNTTLFSCRILYCDVNKLPDIPNARTASSDPTKVSFTNAYHCNFGFTMFGDSRIECLEDGNWSYPSFTCYKDCPPYIQKVGASIAERDGLRFCYNTTVTYSCIQGYYNLTNTMTSCLSSGTWSPFECLKYCDLDTAPYVSNGEASAELINTIHDKATYSCNSGFYKSTASDSIECYKDGNWQTPSIECWKYCTKETVPVISNGVGTAASINTVYDVATYTCSNGFYKSVVIDTIACLTNGDWETPTLECWKYCSPPSGPTHSSAEDALLNEYTNGMEVTFTCTGDYYPNSDDRVTTCMNDGTWTAMGFSCNKYCGQPPIDHGEIISYAVDYTAVTSGGGKNKHTTADTVTYRCLHGSSVQGNNQRRCGGDGNWWGGIKCCIKLACTCCSAGSCYFECG